MLRRLILALACLFCLAVPVLAANEVTDYQTTADVAADGTAQMAVRAVLHLDGPVGNLTFPLPGDAADITLNGQKVSAHFDGTFRVVDLSGYDAAGDLTLNFRFSLPETVTADGKGNLNLSLPLLTGFAYPISAMNFTVTLPGDVTGRPSFSSGYFQESIESHLSVSTDGAVIAGSAAGQLEDHETMTMTLRVPAEQFPTVLTAGKKTVLPTELAAYGLAALAAVLWLLTLRCGLLLPNRRPTPPEGLSAGELGCRLTQTGADLTVMVMHWASLGYLLIQADDNGRVLLHKRMDMGNERPEFENRCFRWLFQRRTVADATGVHYGNLCRKVESLRPKQPGMFRHRSGNVRIFRGISAAAAVCCGLSLGLSWSGNLYVRLVLAVLGGCFGGYSALRIDAAACRLFLRDRTALKQAGLCLVLWLLFGALVGRMNLAAFAMAWLLLSAAAGAFGGRRSDLGRQTARDILGLRRFLRRAPGRELHEIAAGKPDYFFAMMPYALALGVDVSFARHYGGGILPPCPYLIYGREMQRTASEWDTCFRETLAAMDRRGDRPGKSRPAPRPRRTRR